LAGAIDAHTHFVPRALPSGRGRDARWPAVEMTAPDAGVVTIGGRPFRALDSRSWDAARRLDDMDADGIETQVVSPMPELLSYWFSGQDGEAFADHVNTELAELCARAPSRFLGLGMVPLTEPERAARKLADICALGFKGVEIGSHVNGVALGDPRFDIFYQTAEELGLCLLVHPLHPAGLERMAGKPPLAAVAAFPLETALAATALMTHGVATRFPKLRILLSHGGGALPWILPRLSATRALDASLVDLFPEEPRATARRFFYDSILYEDAALRFLAEGVGADRIVVGSDYPFSIKQSRPSEFAERALGLDGETLAVAAMRWLGIGDGA
jgi:aminocarboxymuconate-semialdehyde decarboxylase